MSVRVGYAAPCGPDMPAVTDVGVATEREGPTSTAMPSTIRPPAVLAAAGEIVRVS